MKKWLVLVVRRACEAVLVVAVDSDGGTEGVEARHVSYAREGVSWSPDRPGRQPADDDERNARNRHHRCAQFCQ